VPRESGHSSFQPAPQVLQLKTKLLFERDSFRALNEFDENELCC